MKKILDRLANTPVFFCLISTIILWFVFDNIIIALMVSILSIVFILVCYSLYTLKQKEKKQ
ncbi:MAG: hypothetical protein KGV48_000530 [Alcaligenaceae bacterium]|nr:hypothetical protein [Alcaligenaceae bacterium]